MSIKYKEIASTLRKQILSDGSLVSYKLPTEIELCTAYDTSRQTVRQALNVLIKEGLIYSRQGSGIYTIPLNSHTEGKVVFLLSEEDEYTYPDFISTIKTSLSKEGITPLIKVTGQDYNTERMHLTSLLKQPPAVLVIEGVRDAFDNPNLDLYEQLLARKVSIIFINSMYASLPHHLCISSADYEGGYLLGEHLISSGHYNVSCILPDFAANAKLRYQGMLAAFRDHSLPIPSNEIHWYNRNDLQRLRTKNDTHFLHSFIHSHKRNEAVFCYNDEIAYWLVKEFGYAQTSVPEDAAVVSFDNSYLSRISTPPITTLSLKEHSLETELAEQIYSLLKERSVNTGEYHPMTPAPPNKKTLPWKLISRSSVQIL